jgi:hypothetical protein
MNFRRIRASAMVAAASALLIAVAACNVATPTQRSVYTTATPAPTARPTPVATPTPTPTPTPVPTDTPVPGSPTPVPTAKATPTQSIGPKGPAGGCSGDADKQAFFADAANKLPFSVYCAALPSGWLFASANYTLPSGGVLNVTYKGPAGAQIALQEGAFCITSASDCSPHLKVLGTAKFGDLAGTLDTLGSGFVVYVAPGTARGYTATGTGLTQGAFSGIVVALVKVPKS